MYTSEQISSATMEELQNMVTDVMGECRRARTEAAHHKLQYQMLRMETSETMNRLEVEMQMSHKDVQVLKDQRNSQLFTPELSGTDGGMLSPRKQRVLDLENACRFLEIQNGQLFGRLHDIKTVLVEREGSMLEETERLRERIRQNRKHVNLFRDLQPTVESPSSTFATPSVTPARNYAGGDRFAALLEAASSAPSTPITKYVRTQGRVAPVTPRQAVVPAYGPYFVHPAKSLARALPVTDPTPIRHHHRRRRESRDSTISASDVDAEEQSMTSVGSVEHARQVEPVTPNMSSRMVQSSQSAKRKLGDDSPLAQRSQKRGKMVEGVGLGIGGLRTSP